MSLHPFTLQKYSQGFDLDQGIENSKMNNWFKSKNYSPKLDLDQGRKISKLIIDLNQKITRRNLI